VVRSGMSVSREITALSKVIELVSSELDLDQLLALIAEQACTLIGTEDGAIGLYDGARRVIRTAAVYRMPASELGSEMKAGQGLAGRVLETGRTVSCRYGDLAGISLPELANNQVIGVPVFWRGVLIGFFGIGAKPPRVFTQADAFLLELLARHAAFAIHDAQRQREEHRRSKRLALIAQVAAIIQSGDLIDEILQNTADVMHALLEFESVDIPLLDDSDPNILVVRVRGGAYKTAISQVDRIPVARGIMGAAARERRTQLVNNVANDPRYVNPPGVQPPYAELAVPIMRGDHIFGVLNVEGSGAFDHVDRQCLELIADHLGLAISNARLNAQARSAAVLAERHRLAGELHDNVTQLISSISLLTQSLPQTYKRSFEDGERRAIRIHELAQTAFVELRVLLRELAPITEVDGAGSSTSAKHPAQSLADQAVRQAVCLPWQTRKSDISSRSQSYLGAERLREGGLPAALERLLAVMLPENLRLELRLEHYVLQDLEHEEALYRICQEAVSNVLRHAKAHVLRIQTRLTDSHLLLTITDDGCGVNALRKPQVAQSPIDKNGPKHSISSGLGLSTMRARARALRGLLHIKPGVPIGTVVEVALPRLDRTL
jgi:two-component system, NarL family, sensor kinase